MIVELVAEAVTSGARRDRACAVIGLSARTVARWCAEGGGEDGRAEAGLSPAHKLTVAEKAQIVAHATSPEYCDLSPGQIVPLLADKGIYVASESSFYRVLHERDMMTHREPSVAVPGLRPRDSARALPAGAAPEAGAVAAACGGGAPVSASSAEFVGEPVGLG